MGIPFSYRGAVGDGGAGTGAGGCDCLGTSKLAGSEANLGGDEATESTRDFFQITSVGDAASTSSARLFLAVRGVGCGPSSSESIVKSMTSTSTVCDLGGADAMLAREPLTRRRGRPF